MTLESYHQLKCDMLTVEESRKIGLRIRNNPSTEEEKRYKMAYERIYQRWRYLKSKFKGKPEQSLVIGPRLFADDNDEPIPIPINGIHKINVEDWMFDPITGLLAD